MFRTEDYMLRMPAWSRSPELLRAITSGTPPEPHVDNRLHDSWAMGCLVYEALTDLRLFGKHVDAYEAQAVAALIEPGSSEQEGEQDGEQDGGQDGEQDGEQGVEESQAAVDARFVLLQHKLWVSPCFLHSMNQFEWKSLQSSKACVQMHYWTSHDWACQQAQVLPE